MSTVERYDAVVIGSGFGGSVAALRLTQKGYRVVVLEQGRRVSPKDMDDADRRITALVWAPRLGMRGFFTQRVFRHVGVVGGVGVGGGSLVYAAVLLDPKPSFFDELGRIDASVAWRDELAPHYAEAARMLGRTTNPDHGLMDSWLQRTAERLNVLPSYGPVPQGIHFGDSGADPFFDGRGPPRTGCTRCGSCLTGCAVGAKNTLDKNYLFLAEAAGAVIEAERQAVSIEVDSEAGYRVRARCTAARPRPDAVFEAPRVFVAAGVLGSVELLLRCRDELGTLPRLSPRLGEQVRTNSEAIVGILARDPSVDLTHGATISSHFHADEHTHITQNRFPAGYRFMRWYMGPLVDDPRPVRRALRTLGAMLVRPIRTLRTWLARRWHQRLSVLTVMQSLDNRLSLRLGRSLWTGFRRGLITAAPIGAAPPAYLPVANRAARAFAEVSHGTPLNVLPESVGNLGVTAHILGGCCIGTRPDEGVIDANHRVFGYPGLFVVDGSAVPVNVGVNPSLTITAMAERCLSKIA